MRTNDCISIRNHGQKVLPILWLDYPLPAGVLKDLTLQGFMDSAYLHPNLFAQNVGGSFYLVQP